MEFSKESRLSGSFRSTKGKKRQAEVEEEEEAVEVIAEDDEEEWSPNVANRSRQKFGAAEEK